MNFHRWFPIVHGSFILFRCLHVFVFCLIKTFFLSPGLQQALGAFNAHLFCGWPQTSWRSQFMCPLIPLEKNKRPMGPDSLLEKLTKVPEVTHTLSFYSRGSSLFSLHRQSCLRYWTFFKIAIFGHETWPSDKVPEIAHILSKLPLSPKAHFFLLYGWPFSIYWQFCLFPLGTMLNFNLFLKV